MRELSYRGIFNKENNLLSDNILFITNDITGEQEVCVNLTSFNVDTYIYIAAQIAYYLEHRKFLQPKDLYSTIYDAYNKCFVDGNKVFPIESSPQYKDFMRDVIFPISLENKNQDQRVKEKSVLLAGIQ
jgi:hypothetical protein